MKSIVKTSLFFFICFIIYSCNSARKAQTSLSSGNYDRAIDISVSKLRTNKNKKSRQEYVLLLEDAFAKAVKKDLDRIDFLTTDDNPNNLQEIYETYRYLKNRQEIIRPLLPLRVLDQNREAKFSFKNYNQELVNSKKKLSQFLYNRSLTLLSSQNKYDARKAHQHLTYINGINRGYKDIISLIREAHHKGTDYVFIELKNNTDHIIPRRLEDDLLDIDTYGLDNFWTAYHTKKLTDIDYSYSVQFLFTDIAISPERIIEKQFIKEKTIEDGYTYKVDEDGNRIKDANGNDIKIKKYKDVSCEFYQFIQQKSSLIKGDVIVTDNYSKQPINSFPIVSEFIFEHSYARYKGDERALTNDLLELTDAVRTPFPTTPQMIYDTGEDLKQKLKSVLRRLNFNR